MPIVQYGLQHYGILIADGTSTFSMRAAPMPAMIACEISGDTQRVAWRIRWRQCSLAGARRHVQAEARRVASVRGPGKPVRSRSKSADKRIFTHLIPGKRTFQVCEPSQPLRQARSWTMLSRDSGVER